MKPPHLKPGPVLAEVEAVPSSDLDAGLRRIASAAATALHADFGLCWLPEAELRRARWVNVSVPSPEMRRGGATEEGQGPGGSLLPPTLAGRGVRVLMVEDVADWDEAAWALELPSAVSAFMSIELDDPSPAQPSEPTPLRRLVLGYRRPTQFSDEVRSVAEALGVLVAETRTGSPGRTHAGLTGLRCAGERDELTGLPGRRATERALETAVDDAMRARRDVSVVIIDLDHFRKINHNHGHGFGDACLRAIARSLASSMRLGDSVGRIGGEEFLVILPGTGPQGAWLVAERMRANLVKLVLPAGIGATASFGVASAPDHARASGELLRAAERALLDAKMAGRNRCIVFSAREAQEDADRARDAQADRECYLGSVLALARALDARDHSTHTHSEQVAEYAAAVAVRLGLSGDRVEEIRLAALLHDIGKVGVSDAVLHHPAALSAEGWAEIRRHPEIGANLLVHPGLVDVREWILCHHEHPDGGGYPRGLREGQIPLEALIIGVADAYQAMTSDRPYRRGLPHEVARAELIAGRGTQFDERVVDSFLEWLDGPPAE